MNTDTIDTEPFSYRYLEENDLQSILELQDVVVRGLIAAGTPRFIVPRSADHFITHLSPPHAMYGAINKNNEIVAQSIFRVPANPPAQELGVDGLPGHDASSPYSVIQGILVHPEYKRLGLMRAMLEQWQSWCRERGIKHLSARVEVGHEESKRSFAKNGFAEIDVIIDPRDNARVSVMHKQPEKTSR